MKNAPVLKLSERLGALKQTWPLLRLVWDASPWLAGASILLRLANAVVPLGQLWIGKIIVDQVVRCLAHPGTPPAQLWGVLGLEIVLAVTADLLNRATTLCDSLLADRFNNLSSLRLMAHAQRLDLARFEDPSFHDKLQRAQEETATRTRMLVVLGGMAQQVITLVTLVTSVAAFSPWFLVLLPLAAAPSLLGETRFAMLTYSLLHQQTPEKRELDYLRLLSTSAASAKEVKLFGLGRYLVDRSRELFERFYTANRHLAIQRTCVGAMLGLFPTVGYYGAYALVLMRTLGGHLSLGDMTFLVGSFLRVRTLIEGLFGSLGLIAEHALRVKDLFDFLKVRPTILAPASPVPLPRPFQTGFEFRTVTFTYPGAQRPVLRNLSFRLGVGECLALLGENGAGKTTLVKLLTRLYDPTEGQILLDGIDLRDYDPEAFHREVGAIFQDFVHYDFRARENIAMGNLDAMGDLDRITAAACKSLAAEVIGQLPQGYEQMLGHRFANGIELSLGQWQKIALGRAYLRDPQLLVLDEPTASLDARAEHEVFQRFKEMTRGKTAVLISHRFATARLADRILVLADGTIREEGTHDQLIRGGGAYAELFDLQAAGYR